MKGLFAALNAAKRGRASIASLSRARSSWLWVQRFIAGGGAQGGSDAARERRLSGEIRPCGAIDQVRDTPPSNRGCR